jgi:hypothetical protein
MRIAQLAWGVNTVIVRPDGALAGTSTMGPVLPLPCRNRFAGRCTQCV